MVLAILGVVSAVISATVAGVKGVQARNEATRTEFRRREDFHRAQVVAMTQGSREQLAAIRRSSLDAQAEQARLLNESKESQKKALMYGAGAVVLGMFILSARK